ncbi:hypothetical protein PG985_002287 [Apiospora marii]|uniref:uncharacterized protein n=1 Tax=Apiospora marii TaxID=335849 RepID=UPI0031319DE0
MFFSKTPQPKSLPPQPSPPEWAENELGESGRSCDDLLYFPGSPEFADSETGFHTAQANEVRSAAVARPTSTAEVSALVKALKRSLPPSDLWDALRGGSTNFGIVTAVEMECFPHPAHFRCAYMFYLTPARQATLEALVKLSRRPFDAALAEGQTEPVVDHVIWSITHVPYVPVKIIAVSSSSTGAVGRDNLSEFVAPWTRIPGTPTPREVTHGAYAKEVGDLAKKDGSRNSYKSISVKLDLDLLNTIIDMWYGLVRRTRHTAGLMNTLAFLPVPACVIEASCARRRRNAHNAQDGGGTEATANFFGLRPEDGPLVIVEICHNWYHATDDAEAFAPVDAFLRDVDRVASERGLGSRWVFPNYAQPDERVMQAYGQDRLAQLRRVASKWDPEGFFQKRVVGGFKIEEP